MISMASAHVTPSGKETTARWTWTSALTLTSARRTRMKCAAILTEVMHVIVLAGMLVLRRVSAAQVSS